MKRCKHLGCRLAGMRSCQCFDGKVQRSASYVVWATPAHPEKPWAVGHEIRPGCLKNHRLHGVKAAGGRAGKRLATIDLRQRLRIGMEPKPHLIKWPLVRAIKMR